MRDRSTQQWVQAGVCTTVMRTVACFGKIKNGFLLSKILSSSHKFVENHVISSLFEAE